MNDYPKRLKRQFRELAAAAHERAVRAQLEELMAAFQQWHAGKLGTWELTDLIHRFHDGAARDLFVFYTRAQPNMAVAHAIATGVLQEAEVPAEVRQALAGLIDMQRSWKQESADEAKEQPNKSQRRTRSWS